MALRGCDPMPNWTPIALVVIGLSTQYSFYITPRAPPLFLTRLIVPRLKNEFMANFKHTPYLI